MAARNITSKFEKYRTDAIVLRSRHSPDAPSKESLSGPLLGNALLRSTSSHPTNDLLNAPQLPPEWVDIVDTIQKDLTRVKEALKSLKNLHTQRIKVEFDDTVVKQQEEDIELLAQEITKKLRKCENNIKRIALVGSGELSAKERNIRLNVMRNLAADLTQQSKQFRLCQKDFLRTLNDQESKSKSLGFEEEAKSIIDEDTLDQSLTPAQRQQMEELSTRATEREKEIIRIAKSIHELATLFSELNVLVIEQGSILDRIDYNIEQAGASINKGVKELEEAEKISRKALTCKCMILLTIVLIILIGVLIWKKS